MPGYPDCMLDAIARPFEPYYMKIHVCTCILLVKRWPRSYEANKILHLADVALCPHLVFMQKQKPLPVSEQYDCKCKYTTINLKY